MGRVYEALMRGAGQGRADNHDKSAAGAREDGQPLAAGQIASSPEDLLGQSQFFRPASKAHTEGFISTALPDEQNLRAAGATLDAAAPARAAESDILEISAARVEPHLVAITQPQSATVELYRSLRTRVLQANERRMMQAFVVTSAGPAEGKTVTALNLAWLLAQTDGVKALLIEGDLRRPCVASYLGINGAIGLSDVLAGDVAMSDAIVKLQPAGLHLLPGGSPRNNVAEILSGRRFESALAEARQLFNYIIIDAPPLGIFTDASVMMNRADGALLVIRANQTRYSVLNTLLAPLQQERILGVVLNGVADDVSDVEKYHRYYVKAEGKGDFVAPAVQEMRAS